LPAAGRPMHVVDEIPRHKPNRNVLAFGY
jgi:hypothetical protein